MYIFLFTAISKEDSDRNRTSRDALPSKLQFNGYSEEFLDRIEPNGNIPCSNDDHLSRYGKLCYIPTAQLHYTDTKQLLGY